MNRCKPTCGYVVNDKTYAECGAPARLYRWRGAITPLCGFHVTCIQLELSYTPDITLIERKLHGIKS